MLITQTNLASTYRALGRNEETLRLRRDVYSGTLKLKGEQHSHTLHAANNYAFSLAQLKRSGEAKALLRRTIPVARRALGENNGLTLKMRWIYAKALYDDPAATLDDLREAMTTLEDAERIARRVLGSVHPMTTAIEEDLRNARAALRARETPPPSPPSESA
tara:strand:- start:53 stop:538 length:486 start_codon:yes stop_codon:yes gene_type:complete